MRAALLDRQRPLFPAEAGQHTGQAIARLLEVKTSQNEEKQRKQLEDLAKRGVPACYAAAFERWKTWTEQPDILPFKACTQGPLAIGLGNASPYEVGLTLHHTYGVPFIPGSALKGLARRAALKNGVQETSDEFQTIFGNTEEAGYVTFFDAWLDASSPPPLQLDTITVHHPKYYRDGSVWPTDFDDPTPVAFLSVSPDLTFHFALQGPEAWVKRAAVYLRYGLKYLGVGAKTNAGYGSLVSSEVWPEETEFEARWQTEEQQAREARELEEQERQAELERVAAVEREARAAENRAKEALKFVERINLGNRRDIDMALNKVRTLSTEARQPVLDRFLQRIQADNRTQGNDDLIQLINKAR